jgi:hypothetical protein
LNLSDVEPVRRAAVALDEVDGVRQQWHRDNRRPRALSARDALEAVSYECLVVWAYGKRLLDGHQPTPEDEARVTTALRTIDMIVDEAIG